MKKSVFKIILVLVLFLGIRCNVKAEDVVPKWTTTGTIEVIVSGRVATITGEGSINLTGDNELNIIIDKDAKVILNLNEFTLSTSANVNSVIINNKGYLEINGPGTMLHKANVGDWGSQLISNHPNATLQLNSGTYTRTKNGASYNNGGYIIKNLGSVTIEKDVVMNNGDTADVSSIIASGWDMTHATVRPHTNNIDYMYDENVKISLVINGGTFSGGKRSVTSDPGDNTIINGGTFSDGATGILKSAGNVQINGGVFTAAEGTKLLETEGDGKIEVVNGEFSHDVSTYMNVDSENVQNEDGTYSVNFVYADYSKIDEIIEKVIDEGVDTYTKESITALEKELEKVDWELGKSKQADVNKMIDAVTKAFNQLKKIENPKTGDSAVIYIISAIIMILGIGGCLIYRKKLFN